MSHDISQPVPQGGNGTQDTENSRIAAIANELERLCAVHEAQLGDSQADVSRFETEQRAAEQMAKANGYAYIFDTKTLLYYGTGDDITPMVKKELGIK